MTPWYYYREYGDVNILRQNFGLMQSYVDHLERRSVNGVLKGYAQMGEWGQLNENTPAALVATCAFYQQAVTLSGIAGILGNIQEEEHYREMGKRIREASMRMPNAGSRKKKSTETAARPAMDVFCSPEL